MDRCGAVKIERRDLLTLFTHSQSLARHSSSTEELFKILSNLEMRVENIPMRTDACIRANLAWSIFAVGEEESRKGCGGVRVSGSLDKISARAAGARDLFAAATYLDSVSWGSRE